LASSSIISVLVTLTRMVYFLQSKLPNFNNIGQQLFYFEYYFFAFWVSCPRSISWTSCNLKTLVIFGFASHSVFFMFFH
jgi:hypothetical protein